MSSPPPYTPPSNASVLERLRHPLDSNWQNGSHRGYHFVLLLKSFFTIILISLIIVEYPLYTKYYEHFTYNDPYNFWWRSGMALVPDLVFTFVAFALIFQAPRIVIGGRTWTFHPAFALTCSIILLILYAFMGTVNLLGVYSLERAPEDLPPWANVALTEVGIQFILALVFIWLMILACVAVHRWRKRDEMARTVERVIELVDRREHGKMDG